MTRAQGERVRLRHTLERAIQILRGVEIALDHEHGPPGCDAAQAIAGVGVEIAMGLARLDAYMRAEGDS